MSTLFHWHWLSIVIKVILAVTVFLLSAVLSYTFFLAISPPGLAIFPFAALSLTEGGLVAWLLIFTTMKHHTIKSLIALLMIFFCFVTTITVTFAELIVLFQDHALVSNDTVKNGTLILLEFMLGMHVLAATADFLVGKIEWLLKMHGRPKEAENTNSPTTPEERAQMIADTREHYRQEFIRRGMIEEGNKNSLPPPHEHDTVDDIVIQNGNVKKKSMKLQTPE